MKDTSDEKKILHELDDQLILLTKKVNLLKYLTPINLTEERNRFVKAEGIYNPQFTYNFPDGKEIVSWIKELQDMKKKYFDKKIYAHPISKLLLDKIEGIIGTAELLLAYTRQDFTAIAKYNTLLFGTFDPEILKQAEEILQSYQEAKPEIRGAMVTGDDIQHYILDYMQKKDITGVKLISTKQGLSKFVITFGEKSCHLYYSPHMKVRKHTLKADLIHELGVHYQRYTNGKATGWHILTFGTKNYLATEEGLALYRVCEYKKTIYPSFQKIGIYQKYLLLFYAQGKSFTEIVKYILDRGRSKNFATIFTMIIRGKQGIQDTSCAITGNIFLKNKLYAEGYYEVKKRCEQGNNPDILLHEKINIADLQYLSG